MHAPEAPFIYNLFPRLAGKIPEWSQYLPHIKKMGFNWIYLNPFNAHGFSGSLYSIRDYFAVDPLFAINFEDRASWASFRVFTELAHHAELNVMLDLVANHTAIDAVDAHPDWYQHKWALFHRETGHPALVFEQKDAEEIAWDEDVYPPEDYELRFDVARPYAISPTDTRDVQVWGDLAELDFNGAATPEILAFFKRYLSFCIRLGVDGFRCDAAYQLDGGIWGELIANTKKIAPDTLFWAEMLGGNGKQHRQLAGTGFDFFTNSSKWWDYTAPWAIDQHAIYGQIAPSISFPETHDTPRLAAEVGGRRDVQVFKYFFAVFFSAGTLIPMGYEWGARTRLHVVKTTPNDPESPHFDIRSEITAINRLARHFPVFREEGELTLHPYPDPNILVLQKDGPISGQSCLLIYNKDWSGPHPVDLQGISPFFGGTAAVEVISVDFVPHTFSSPRIQQNLEPNEFFVLIARI